MYPQYAPPPPTGSLAEIIITTPDSWISQIFVENMSYLTQLTWSDLDMIKTSHEYCDNENINISPASHSLGLLSSESVDEI